MSGLNQWFFKENSTDLNQLVSYPLNSDDATLENVPSCFWTPSPNAAIAKDIEFSGWDRLSQNYKHKIEREVLTEGICISTIKYTRIWMGAGGWGRVVTCSMLLDATGRGNIILWHHKYVSASLHYFMLAWTLHLN